MVTRVADYAQTTQMQAMLRQTQARIAEAQVDIAAGTSARRYSEVADRAGLLVTSRQQQQLTDRFITENQNSVDRANVMSGALSGVTAVAERLRNLLVARLDGASGASVPLDDEIQGMLAEVQGLLNTKLDGRYLFAGSRTDAPPVAIPSPPPTGTDAALYYSGDSQKLAARVEVGVEVSYGVTADEQGFVDLIGALGQALSGDALDDRDLLQQALDRSGAAIEALATRQGMLGMATARIETTMQAQTGSSGYLGELIGRIIDTDTAAAYTQIANDTASLEASYLLTSKLSQLTLADYLR